MDKQDNKERLVEVDGKQMSQQQLDEKKETMPNSERLTEVKPDEFRTLKRMRE